MDKLVAKFFEQSQIPAENLAVCKSLVEGGLKVGVNLGEKLNEWIDKLFENINK